MRHLRHVSTRGSFRPSRMTFEFFLGPFDVRRTRLIHSSELALFTRLDTYNTDFEVDSTALLSSRGCPEHRQARTMVKHEMTPDSL